MGTDGQPVPSECREGGRVCADPDVGWMLLGTLHVTGRIDAAHRPAAQRTGPGPKYDAGLHTG